MDSVTLWSLTLVLHNTVQYINVQSFKRKLSRLGIGHYCNVCLSICYKLVLFNFKVGLFLQ